jgi:hypothetical protein
VLLKKHLYSWLTYDELQDRADVSDEDIAQFYWQDCCNANEAQEPCQDHTERIGVATLLAAV